MGAQHLSADEPTNATKLEAGARPRQEIDSDLSHHGDCDPASTVTPDFMRLPTTCTRHRLAHKGRRFVILLNYTVH
jgi:hypothetical protein